MLQPEQSSTQLDLLKCPVCYSEYDELECTPKILPNCGHTLCIKCLRQIQLKEESPKCPLDRRAMSDGFMWFREFVTNTAIVQLIKENSLQKNGMCTSHQEPITHFCLSDHTPICESCKEGCDDAKHKGHEVKSLAEIQEGVEAKKVKIKAELKKVDAEHAAIAMLLDDKKSEIRRIKKRKFDHIRTLIDKKEEETWSEIELLFAHKKTKTQEVFRKDEELKQQWHIELAVLNNKKMDQKFFDTLNKEITEKCTLKDEKEKLEVLSRKLNAEFKSTDMHLNTDLVSIFKRHQPKIKVIGKQYEIEEKTDDYIVSQINSSFQSKRKGDNLKIRFQHNTLQNEKEPEKERLSLDLTSCKGVKVVDLDLRRTNLTEDVFSTVSSIGKELTEVSDISILFNTKNEDEFSKFFSQDFWATEKAESFKFNVDEDIKCLNVRALMLETLEKVIFPSFFKMVNLKIFSVCLSASTFTDESLIAFADQVLPKLQKLESFSLDLTVTLVSDVGVKHFCTKIKDTFKKVKDFDLDVSGTKVKRGTLNALVQHALPNLPALEGFGLKMNHIKVDDLDVKDFFIQSRVFLHKVKRFEIGMMSTKVSKKTVKSLAKYALPAMTMLEKLDLNFNGTDGKINDKCARKIFKNCRPEKIKSFKLHLARQKLTDDAIVFFARELLPKMEELESLDLMLDSPNVSFRGLNELWLSLKPISLNLKTFSFSFRDLDVNWPWMDWFVNSMLPCLRNLRQLELAICNTFTQENFEVFFEELKKIAHKLKIFSLGLGCDMIVSDENIKVFAEQVLPLMVNLQRLKIAFSKCDNITKKSVEIVCGKIKEINTLDFGEIRYADIKWPEEELEAFKKSNPEFTFEKDKILYL